MNAHDEVERIRAETKALRLAGAPDDAIARLEEAIAGFQRVISAHPDDRQAAHALVELNGMLGGAYRERGDFRRSAAAYDAGFRYESDPRFGGQTSYNRLNRLVSRILLHPRVLSDPESLRAEPLEFVDVPRELMSLLATLRAQFEGPRKGDPWAAGDLALASVLSGSEATVARLADLASTSPQAWVYHAYREVFAMLARLDTPCKKELNSGVAWFDARLAERETR